MRILIADDNQFVRRGIVGLLAQEDDLKVCGEASDSADAIHKATELGPDVILLDISMPGGNGLDTARVLKQKLPETKILLVSQHDTQHMLLQLAEVGASGCVDKARLAIDLLPAIRGLQNQSVGHAS
jgi:two-component system, NarL family, response regulator NreC